MRSIVGRVMSIAVAAAIALAPVGAWAQTGGGETTGTGDATVTAPVVTDAAKLPSVDVQLWPDDQAVPGSTGKFTSLVVTAEFPDDVKLPATIRLPLPDGIELQWVGEVFGGDPAKDVERQYRTGKGTGGTYIDVTLQQARRVQYEGLWQPTRVEGARRSATLDWIQSVPTGKVTFSVKTPAYGGDLSMTPTPAGPPLTNQRGEKLFSSERMSLKTGQSIKVSLDFAAGSTATAPASRSQSNVGTLVPVLIGAVLVMLGAVVLLMRQRPATAGVGEPAGEESEDEL